MSKQNDGGYAFPCGFGAAMDAEAGMSLRDYFAAKAMVGLLVGKSLPVTGDDPIKILATAAFNVADAMIEEREK